MFKPNQKVRINRQGSSTLTVHRQQGTTVWVYELNIPIHSTKLIAA